MNRKIIVPVICALVLIGLLSGCTEENAAPQASFTYDSTNMFIETEFTFTDASTDDGTIESWNWDWGNGETSTEQNPTYTWTEAGTYTVTLTVTDDGGATDEYTMDLTITLKDIVQTIYDEGYTTLYDALTTAELIETLQGAGPYTIFVPTEDAFVALDQTWWTDLLADATNLNLVLTYHVLSGTVKAADITDGLEAETLETTSLTFTIADTTVTINGAATVTQTDIECWNGWIHVIDAVLIPDSVPGPA